MLAGILVGAGIVLGSQLLDPRLRREEQLRRYRIPILARIPLERIPRGRKASPLLPTAVSPATHDAYLLLGATLAPRDGLAAKRSVLLTGPNSGDGKSTSALNLATALSATEPVVLIETDSRHPSLARVLGVRPLYGLTNVISRRTPLRRALVGDLQVPNLQLLVQLPNEAPLSPVMSPTAAEWLVREVQKVVNWVVIDAAPLAIVPDVLPLAKEVDDVILVVRLGNTRLRALEELAGLLVQQGVTPVGFVLVGGRPNASYYGG
jgi:Mrp family chromosome partitioning ATPase